MIAFEDRMRRGGGEAIREAGRFFMRDDPVHQTLRDIASRLRAHKIEYAVAGGMALVAHGYVRTTIDVDILVTEDGLRSIHAALDGRGYLPPFEGSRNLRDTSTGVRIEFLVTGQYPGDGKPKPVAFPAPEAVSEEREGVRYLRLESLIELKLASGISSPGRLRDLADVQELIRALQLPLDLAERLAPYVADKYRELHAAVSDAGGGGL